MLFYYVGCLASLIIFGTHVLALRLDIHGERKHQTRGITRRAPGVTSSELNNTADVSYYVNLELGGKAFQLLLDTGRYVGSSYICKEVLPLFSKHAYVSSSDLWVAGDVPNSESTQFTSGVNYAVGGVQGAHLMLYRTNQWLIWRTSQEQLKQPSYNSWAIQSLIRHFVSANLITFHIPTSTTRTSTNYP